MRNRSPTDYVWDVPLVIHSAYHFTVPWVSCTVEPLESFLVAYDFLFRVFSSLFLMETFCYMSSIASALHFL